MSTAIYVQGFHRGEPTGLSEEGIFEIFDTSEKPHTAKVLRLKYDESNSVDVHLIVENARVIALTIERPCAHAKLYANLLGLLRSERYFAYMPGSRVFSVLGASRDLPYAMAMSLGPVVNVAEPDQLREGLVAV